MSSVSAPFTDEEIEDIKFALQRCAEVDEVHAKTEDCAGTYLERALHDQAARFRRLVQKITA